MKLGAKSDAFQRHGQPWYIHLYLSEFCTNFQVILSLKLERCLSIFTSFLCSLEVESWKEEFQKHPKEGIWMQLDQAALEDLYGLDYAC
ncbi:hypothetical protein Bca4012_065984 [Brassica carinata]